MIRKAILLLTLFIATASLNANTTLLENTNFDGYDGWIMGSNKFLAGNWVAFVEAPDAYPYSDRIEASGDGFIFKSWDDGESDRLETYVFQEFMAGPETSAWPTIFETGDVIRFRGSAMATLSGTDTSDVVARAFIKVLGYNEMGWEFQTKDEYSAFFPLTGEMQDFDLSVTYPDLTVDDSLQVLQIGFELTTLFDGSAMDSGQIYFEDIEAFIEGDGGEEPQMWAHYTIQDGKYVDTGDWLGYLDIQYAPIIFCFNLNSWIYLPEEHVSETEVSLVWIMK